MLSFHLRLPDNVPKAVPTVINSLLDNSSFITSMVTPKVVTASLIVSSAPCKADLSLSDADVGSSWS